MRNRKKPVGQKQLEKYAEHIAVKHDVGLAVVIVFYADKCEFVRVGKGIPQGVSVAIAEVGQLVETGALADGPLNMGDLTKTFN